MKRLILAYLALPLAAAEVPQVLWRDPGTPTMQDFICGPGGCDQKPVPPFEFLKDDTSGTNPKITVRDAKARTWSIKFGVEVIPECFGSRFVSALGFVTEPTFYVAEGKVERVGKLRGARRHVKSDGTFRRGRFEPRGQKDFEFLKDKSWSWVDNPFSGTHELAGLKIVMMLLSNWDAKDSRDGDETNNGVFRTPQGLLYSMTDWGASLGHWGSVLRRDQSDCSAYAMDSPHFVRRKGDALEWGFAGKRGDDLKNGVRVADVRWLLPLLGRITPDQIRAGFKASGATSRQTACWTGAIEQRIGELRAAAK